MARCTGQFSHEPGHKPNLERRPLADEAEAARQRGPTGAS